MPRSLRVLPSELTWYSSVLEAQAWVLSPWLFHFPPRAPNMCPAWAPPHLLFRETGPRAIFHLGCLHSGVLQHWKIWPCRWLQNKGEKFSPGPCGQLRGTRLSCSFCTLGTQMGWYSWPLKPAEDVSGDSPAACQDPPGRGVKVESNWGSFALRCHACTLPTLKDQMKFKVICDASLCSKYLQSSLSLP